jgi:hypothetical protein
MPPMFAFFARLSRPIARLAKLAAYISLGPIAGPMAAMAERYARRGELILAAMWLTAIPLIWLDIASLTAFLAHKFHIS